MIGLWQTIQRTLSRLSAPGRRAVSGGQETAADFERAMGLDAGALDGVQLTPSEFRPIVAAIRARPGGSLLVFGCGRDSPVWEKLNAGGSMAFIEDDPHWATAAKARLEGAPVFLVEYGTRRKQWRRLLKRPAELSLALPEAVRARPWDVIVVDGPAGYDNKRPGRMKSIYEASRLVARPGKIFVHDAERRVEAAYAARYLGKQRLFVEVRGAASLRGYQF